MRCIAIATRLEQQDPQTEEYKITTTWHVSKPRGAIGSFFSAGLINRITEEIKDDVTELCDTMSSQDVLHFENEGMHTHIQKLGSNCCAIICDEELTKTQLNFITDYALIKKIPLATIAADPEGYSHYYEARAVKAELDKTKEIAKQNLEKVLQRGDKIDDLIEKATTLEDQSKIFQRMTEKVDSSCWPSWSSLRSRCVIS